MDPTFHDHAECVAHLSEKQERQSSRLLLYPGMWHNCNRQQEDLVVVITFGNMTFQEHMHILRSVSSASKGHEDDEMMT